ncbi:MAG: hypothetical protein WDN69_04225 [Aliidongia sp.]
MEGDCAVARDGYLYARLLIAMGTPMPPASLLWRLQCGQFRQVGSRNDNARADSESSRGAEIEITPETCHSRARLSIKCSVKILILFRLETIRAHSRSIAA